MRVGEILKRKPLGDLLHAYFENYACDEGLPAEHWFWDRSKSGGIFVEHGVHFFDLFAGWLGPGKVESAQCCVRPGTIIEDQVQCTVRYGDGVLVNFYHGFTQLGRMDRQELRLVFERGDVRLEEWIPVRATIHAVVDEADTRTLCELFPGARLDVTAWYSGKDRACSGRHKALDVYQMIEMSYGEGDLRCTVTVSLSVVCLRTNSPGLRTADTCGRSPSKTDATPWQPPSRPTDWPIRVMLHLVNS